MPTPMPRILVTGSRNWDDTETIAEALHLFYRALGKDRSIVLVHGGARGADAIAAEIWRNQGLPVEAHPADWKTHGRRAGFLRNQEMVRAGADVCLAFIKDDSKGATMCANLAEQAGIPVLRFNADAESGNAAI